MAENTFELKIISPDGMFYEDQAEFLEFTTTSGEMGVYAQHVPTVAILEPCVVRIHAGGELKKAAVLGGFIQIFKTQITIMAEDAQWPEAIDVERANAAMERAKKRLSAPDESTDVLRAEAALKRALVRLESVR